ncbi:heme exporter protein CcmD [Pseudomonas cremoricolorata]|uniref:Heme exporter protein D n=1 Tax=Pseudomonas cremoricolorata TaxID=157783 RepID=A0A089WSH3_9PSED|nr:heme exporter protein CcmD [Pseudomonas cremoricolorata]AIR90109.1 hemagglutination activity protein [Pseudomonas cremoricolorata]
MNFASLSDFFAMGHHGLYVWSAYGVCLLVLAVNVAAPVLARRRYLQEEARRLRRESKS